MSKAKQKKGTPLIPHVADRSPPTSPLGTPLQTVIESPPPNGNLPESLKLAEGIITRATRRDKQENAKQRFHSVPRNFGKKFPSTTKALRVLGAIGDQEAAQGFPKERKNKYKYNNADIHASAPVHRDRPRGRSGQALKDLFPTRSKEKDDDQDNDQDNDTDTPPVPEIDIKEDLPGLPSSMTRWIERQVIPHMEEHDLEWHELEPLVARAVEIGIRKRAHERDIAVIATGGKRIPAHLPHRSMKRPPSSPSSKKRRTVIDLYSVLEERRTDALCTSEQLTDDNFVLKFTQQHLRMTRTTSNVPSKSEWIDQSEVKFTARGKLLKAIDQAVYRHNKTLETVNGILRNSRIICRDEIIDNSQSSIQFSFSLFEQMHFSVGPFSVLGAWNIFSDTKSEERWSDSVWEIATQSKYIGKELMQSAPDLTSMIDAGNRERANIIMHNIQITLLHNLCVCAFLFSNEESLISGERLCWKEIYACQQTSKNSEILQEFADMVYIFEPREDQLQEILEGDDSWRSCESKPWVLSRSLYWITIYRTLMTARLARLCDIINAIAVWQDDFEVDPREKARENPISSLEYVVRAEFEEFLDVVAKLPTTEVVSHTPTSTVSNNTSLRSSKRKRHKKTPTFPLVPTITINFDTEEYSSKESK